LRQLSAILVVVVLVISACQSPANRPLPSPVTVHTLQSTPHTDAKPPLVLPDFKAKVVVGDPNDPRRTRETFTPGPNDPNTGVPLDTLGDWVQLEEPASAPSSPAGQAAAGSVVFARSVADLPALQDESGLCAEGSNVPDCVVFTYGWESLSPEAGVHTNIWCPSSSPYLASLAEPASGSNEVPSDWQRDHWTITLWNFSAELDPNGSGYFMGVTYWGQNWNTVFGDTWHYAVFIGCGGNDAATLQSE
jgi:hypothetical protein